MEFDGSEAGRALLAGIWHLDGNVIDALGSWREKAQGKMLNELGNSWRIVAFPIASQMLGSSAHSLGK
jgi:hypothetical protein